jgi:hypothetical protein
MKKRNNNNKIQAKRVYINENSKILNAFIGTFQYKQPKVFKT